MSNTPTFDCDNCHAWEVVHEAILAFGSKVPDLGKARAALLRVIDEGAWKHYTPPIGEPCDPTTFRDWVVARVPRGLETSVENLRQIARGDTKLENALDRELQNPVGGSNKVVLNVDNINIENDQRIRPRGTSKDHALRRLRKDAPELHADVLAGNLSAHAAMVRAGFRPHTFTVRPDPESAARTLRKHLTPQQLAELVRLLTGHSPEALAPPTRRPDRAGECQTPAHESWAARHGDP
ncbi:MAG: hypothetical protein ACRDQ7_08010 [Haloechinothrix sp.]